MRFKTRHWWKAGWQRWASESPPILCQELAHLRSLHRPQPSFHSPLNTRTSRPSTLRVSASEKSPPPLRALSAFACAATVGQNRTFGPCSRIRFGDPAGGRTRFGNQTKGSCGRRNLIHHRGNTGRGSAPASDLSKLAGLDSPLCPAYIDMFNCGGPLGWLWNAPIQLLQLLLGGLPSWGCSLLSSRCSYQVAR